MCLIAFAYDTHPEYKLVLAANRDEFYQRPTRAAQFWNNEDKPHLLAGKDLEAGGTWMGVHKDGRWGALTNFRAPSIQKQNPPTRGELVIDYLSQPRQASEYLKAVHGKSGEYNGFNLLLWDENEFYHYSNQNKEAMRIQPGIHGISNAFLDTPWPKLEKAKSDLKSVLSETEFKKEDIFTMLKNDQQASASLLPETGIPKEWEKAVSSIFIKTENYGTRCSTLLLIDYEGNIDFTERRYKPGSIEIKEESNFRIENSRE